MLMWKFLKKRINNIRLLTFIFQTDFFFKLQPLPSLFSFDQSKYSNYNDYIFIWHNRCHNVSGSVTVLRLPQIYSNLHLSMSYS